MTPILSSLARNCHEVLAGGDTPSARTRLAELLAQALREPAFLQELFAGPMPERKIVYQDPQLGFCILAHEYQDARHGGPHDHGPSWAIYGQAEGETVMTEFALIEPASAGQPGRVRALRRYTMRPGDVHAYERGEIHAPSRSGPTRLVRIEGQDLANVARGSYLLMDE